MRMPTKILQIWFILFVSPVLEVYSQTSPPTVACKVLQQSFPEDLKFDTVLAIVTAQSNSGAISLFAYNDYTNKRVFINETSHSIVSSLFTTTANVALKERMNREEESIWKLLVAAQDTIHSQTAVVTCEILISDVNDQQPEFKDKLYQITLPENKPSNTNVITVHADDPDNGAGGVVNYTLKADGQSSSLYDGAFSIDPKNGTIRLQKSLDYSRLSFYQYVVIGMDGGGLTGTASLIIKVEDVQNKPPYFTGLPFYTQISENTGIGEKVPLLIRADDGDTGVPHKIEYFLVKGECIPYFDINATTGQIKIKKDIDRDSGTIRDVKGVCTLDLMAKEIPEHNETDPGPSSSNTTVVITVLDIDDNKPTFNSMKYNASVEENLTGVPLTVSRQGIYVSDIDQGPNSIFQLELLYDNGTKVYDILPVPDTIQDNSNITLYLQGLFSFDYEHGHSVDLVLLAKETKDPSKSTNVSIHLNIIDRNDITPHFPCSSYNVLINEDEAQGQTVLNITAKDEDSGIYGTITYSLRGSDRFVVDNKTALITTNGDLDRETRDEYVLILMAVDGGGNLQTIEITVKLKDVNDNSPKFTQSSYIGFVKENEISFDQEVILTATDLDLGNNSVIKFTLVELPDHIDNNFTISTYNNSDGSYSGVLSLQKPLDFEALRFGKIYGTIQLQIQATDFGKPSRNTTCTVIINVQDINDNTPCFIQSSYVTNIFENATFGTGLTDVCAKDDDGTEANREVSYYIEKGGFDHFRINGRTGRITVDLNAKFDRETISMYNLTVLAIDRGTPPRTGTSTVTVIIDDVNDEPPKFIQPEFTASVYENASLNAIVAKCSANDPDTDPNLFYKIVGIIAEKDGKNINETVKDYFNITFDTGAVNVFSTLDRETTDKVTLILSVEDLNAAVNSTQTATATLLITILDVNDNPPIFPDAYNVNITEGKISGTVITVFATDADLYSDITYTITDNYLNNSFDISSKTGIISRNNEIDIDRECNAIITIIVEANDTLFTNTTKVIMTVFDVNDNSPEFESHSSIVYVTENNGTNPSEGYNNTFLLDLNATDRDEGLNAELTYRLTNGYSNFKIDSETGLISAHGHFDREITDRYILTVTVNDNDVDTKKRRTSTTTLTVIILDRNDNYPNFQQTFYVANVREDAQENTKIIIVSATDKDLNQTLRYFIDTNSSNGSGLFTIDETTGAITVNTSLLNKYGNYSLNVAVVDNDNFQNETRVQIEVKDINNNWPVFRNLNKTYEVFECVRNGSIVTTLNATDADFGENSKLSFYFINQTSEDFHSHFELESTSGVIKTVAKLNAEKHSKYNLRVEVQDHGTPVLSSTADIQIKVIDVNDNPPQFKFKLYNASVVENTVNRIVTTMKAFDHDTNSVLTYSIEKQSCPNCIQINDSCTNCFQINETTGEIIIVKEIDREKIDRINILVKAIDSSGQVVYEMCDNSVTIDNYTTTDLDVYIKDQDDNPPKFKNGPLRFGKRRTVKKGETIVDLTKMVEDNDVDIQNKVHQFSFNGYFTYSNNTKLEQQIHSTLLTQTSICSNEAIKRPVCLNNGTLSTNINFEENMSGYFDMPVIAWDAAGNSTAIIKLDIISDSQTATLVLNGNKAYVESVKENLMRGLSQKLNYNFNADSIRAPETTSASNVTSSMYLDIYVTEKNTERILSAGEVIALFDFNADVFANIRQQYGIADVKEYTNTFTKSVKDGIKTTFILIGVIVLLGITVLMMIVCYCRSVSKYQLKLKSATTMASVDQDADIKESHPGTNIYARNQNPLLNKEAEFNKVEYARYNGEDDLSVSSYDSDQFDKKKPARGEEEKGATMDMFEEEVDMQGEIDALAMVLQQHKKEKDASQESLVANSKHSRSIQPEFSQAFNDGFELRLETTEV